MRCLFLLVIVLLLSCGRNSVPQQSEKVVADTIPVQEFWEGQSDLPFVSEPQVVIIDSTKPCPPATIVYAPKKVKKSNNRTIENSFNEINDLKRAVQVKDSQIDSLTIQLGKKCVGQQTNNGTKWWVFVLLGMAIGISGYQGVRSAITKKW
jgi:hypothetical protein